MAAAWTLAKVYASRNRVVYKASADGAVAVVTKSITCTGAVTPDLITDTDPATRIGQIFAACKTPAAGVSATGIDSQAKAESVVYGGKNPLTGATSSPVLALNVVKTLGTATSGSEVTATANTNASGSLRIDLSCLAAAACDYAIEIKALPGYAR
jgi:hypothetical protein